MQNKLLQFSKYVLLVFAGVILLVLCSKIQPAGLRRPGEYYYSSFFRNNYTILSASLFVVVGIFVGYFSRLNPWLGGLSLIFIFPLVSLYEATIYRGSHNLIPFEMVIYFVWALPGIAGIYLGRFISRLIKMPEQSK